MKFKRGDTFSFAGQASAVVNGVATSDFTGWSILCQVRTVKGRLVEALTVTWLAAATGALMIESNGPTVLWPVEPLIMDLQFSDATGAVISTDTVAIMMVPDVTRAV